MSIITDCTVVRLGANAITNPTIAVQTGVDDINQPNIEVTGGVRDNLLKTSGYKIAGTVNGLARNWPNMKCTDNGDPAKFIRQQG